MILCLETSAKACTVAIAQDGNAVATQEAVGDWKHSKVLTLLIQDCLQSQSLTMKDLTAVAVSQGPGSYTGLRVGASCAKGICYTLNLPLISVATLEIIAYPFLSALEDEAFVVPMIDARRKEVYYNLYDMGLNASLETNNLVLDDDSIAQFRGKKMIFCGDGAHKMSEFKSEGESWSIESSIASAQNMTHLAQEKLAQGATEDVAYYTPFYLKPPNITKSTKSLF